jgi:hypothetical protein
LAESQAGGEVPRIPRALSIVPALSPLNTALEVGLMRGYAAVPVDRGETGGVSQDGVIEPSRSADTQGKERAKS